MPNISFNGQEYESREAMPPEVRRLYDLATGMLADTDGDGVPDMLEGMAGEAPQTFTRTQFIVDGTSYASVEAMPPDVRQRYEQAMGRFDANRNGVPDLIEGAAPGPFATPAAPSPTTPTSPATSTPPHVTVIGGGGGLSVSWIIAIAVIVLFGAAVVSLLLLR